MKATNDQWAYQEHWATEDGDAACLLELRARVEALEATLYDVRCNYLRLANAVANFAPNRAEFFTALHHDPNEEESITAYYEALSAQHRGKAVFHGNSSAGLTGSLVERVAVAIGDYDSLSELWRDDARAAIRETAAWLHEGGDWNQITVAALLEQEAEL